MSQFQSYPQMEGMQQPGFQPAVGFQQPSPQMPSFPTQFQQQPQLPAQVPFHEQSFIENILRLNRGKIATIYMNFENSQWG